MKNQLKLIIPNNVGFNFERAQTSEHCIKGSGGIWLIDGFIGNAVCSTVLATTDLYINEYITHQTNY